MDRMELLRSLVSEHINTDTDTDTDTNEEEDDEYEDVIIPPLNAGDDRIVIYKDDDPYQNIETDLPGVIQVIGNEIITLTRGEGVCCVCHNINVILYADNSFGGNIPVQVCEACIASILHP
jgi:hypothetical protein